MYHVSVEIQETTPGRFLVSSPSFPGGDFTVEAPDKEDAHRRSAVGVAMLQATRLNRGAGGARPPLP